MFVQPINFRFDGYTVAATDNVTARITSIEETSSRKLSAEIGLAGPGLKSAIIEPSEEQAVKSSTDITAQYEQLGIDIVPEFLRIIRESGTAGDVIGNTRVSVSLVTDPLTIQRRYPSAQNEPKISIRDDVVLLVTSTHLVEDNGKDLDETKASFTAVPQVRLPHCKLLGRVDGCSQV
jgi:hypothetical protein